MTAGDDARTSWEAAAVPGVAGAATAEEAGPTPAVGRRRSQFRRRFLAQRAAVVALGFLLFVIATAVFAPLLVPYDPLEQDLANVLASPDGRHLIGTDDIGRDVLSRLIFASRISLVAAAEAVAIGLLLGVGPGLLAGYAGGWIDAVLLRLTDALLSFPPLILAFAIVGMLGPSLVNAMIGVGIVFAPRFLRLIRGAALNVREETFIEASRSIGTPTRRIVRTHVLPNVLSPLIVQVSLAGGVAMLAEAGLSFVGLGVQPPDASWGSLLGRAFPYVNSAPWLIIFPGLAIALTVLAFNALGDGLRDAIGREVRTGR